MSLHFTSVISCFIYIEKIRSKQEQDKRIKGASQSITAIEEFCEKFDRSKHGSVSIGFSCLFIVRLLFEIIHHYLFLLFPVI